MDLDDDELKASKQMNNDNYVKTLETKIIELHNSYLKCSLDELSDRIENLYLEVKKREEIFIDE